MTEPKRCLRGRLSQFTRHRKIKIARGDNTHRMVINTQIPHGKRRIIIPRSPATNQNRIMGCPHQMNQPPRGGISNPLAIPSRGCNTSIKTRGQLEAEHGTAFITAQKEALVILCSTLSQNPCRDGNASGTQHVKSATIDAWIMIRKGRNHMSDLSVNQGLSTGRRLTDV